MRKRIIRIMKPVNFRGNNTVYGGEQPEYQPLPARLSKDEKVVTTVWELTPEELEEIKVTRRVKIKQGVFGEPLQPLKVAVLKQHELY